MIVEALSRALHQLGGGVQINLGAGHRAVTEVGRQRRKLGEEIVASAVPGQQSRNGEGVAQIVDPGTAEPEASQDLQERGGESRDVIASTQRRGKKWRRRLL